ncbi:hypothetical protein [Lactobacillus taiwanensis]|nr:hypothetical protein [Lactobacillus taiwanensis]
MDNTQQKIKKLLLFQLISSLPHGVYIMKVKTSLKTGIFGIQFLF